MIDSLIQFVLAGYDFAGAGGAGGGSLGDDLRSLRAQLDVLTRRIEQAG